MAKLEPLHQSNITLLKCLLGAIHCFGLNSILKVLKHFFPRAPKHTNIFLKISLNVLETSIPSNFQTNPILFSLWNRSESNFPELQRDLFSFTKLQRTGKAEETTQCPCVSLKFFSSSNREFHSA